MVSCIILYMLCVCCFFAMIVLYSMNENDEPLIEDAGWSAGQFGALGHGKSAMHSAGMV